MSFMTRSEMQSKIRILRDELENRHKYGTVKLAKQDGTTLSSKEIQEEMYSLIYKMSRSI